MSAQQGAPVGQVGAVYAFPSHQPFQLAALAVGYAAVSLFHDAQLCALLDNGAVRCWGRNNYGQLGYANTTTIGVPGSNVVLGDAAIQISVGYDRTCALLATGRVRCWGSGQYGGLGYGNTNNIGDDETPAPAGDVPIGGRAVQVSVGNDQTCALLESGNVRCWGKGLLGCLGYGNTNNIGDDETPASVSDVNVGAPVAQIATGYNTCARLTNGNVRC